ncbi:hypothetical protein D3C85_1495370 [compost metagenome]
MTFPTRFGAVGPPSQPNQQDQPNKQQEQQTGKATGKASVYLLNTMQCNTGLVRVDGCASAISERHVTA